MLKLFSTFWLLVLLTSFSPNLGAEQADSSPLPISEQEKKTADSTKLWPSCLAGGISGLFITPNPTVSWSTAGTAGIAIAAGIGNHQLFDNPKNDMAFWGCGALGFMVRGALAALNAGTPPDGEATSQSPFAALNDEQLIELQKDTGAFITVAYNYLQGIENQATQMRDAHAYHEFKQSNNWSLRQRTLQENARLLDQINREIVRRNIYTQGYLANLSHIKQQ